MALSVSLSSPSKFQDRRSSAKIRYQCAGQVGVERGLRARGAVALTTPLQKFASVHANLHNHFNLERHLVDRETYKTRRSAALAEWQSLMT